MPFLQNQSCPVVVTNLNTSLVPEVINVFHLFSNFKNPYTKLTIEQIDVFFQLDNLYVRSLVKEINGHTIGLVGYITPHTKFISNSGKVEEILGKKTFIFKLMLSGHFHGRNRIIAKGGC